MDYKYISKELDETLTLAENFEAEKFPNMVICLDGDLGAGKTVFTKAFAAAMGIKENVTSPTFNIIKEYDGELPLFHMDVYRTDGDISELGLEEYFSKMGVTIIEWGSMIREHLPEEYLEIKIIVLDENARKFKIIPHGKKYEIVCDNVIW